MSKLKIGFLIQDQSQLFNNGCNQQGLFVYQTLTNTKEFDCLLFTDKCKNNKFVEIPCISIEDNHQSLYQLDCLICLSLQIKQKEYILKLKENNVKIINYNCGNMLYIFQEDIIFDKHNYIGDLEHYNYCDQYWIIPNYKNDIDFYESITKNDVLIAPYVWNKTIIDYQTNGESLFYNNLLINKDMKYLIIAEPNRQITKTCLYPLLICEEYYKKNTNIKVICLCKLNTNAFNNFAKNLQIVKDNKVEFYPRAILIEIIKQLRDKKTDIYFISHHKDNPLNFLHLEVLYLQYPLIHNSEDINKAGYYYKTIKDGCLQLEKAVENHNNNLLQYKINTNLILEEFSPENKKNQEIYKKYLINICSNKTNNTKDEVLYETQNILDISKEIMGNEKLSLVVIPTHGFANRLRMIASAFIYANYLKIPLKICWKNAKECNIDIDLIFKNYPFDCINFDEIEKSKYHYFGLVHTEELFTSIELIVNNNKENNKFIVIEGGHEFRHPETEKGNFVRLKSEFYNLLKFHDIFNNVLSKPYIALHYRDEIHKYDEIHHSFFTSNSPLEKFYEVLSEYKDKIILIISNNSNISGVFKTKFPESIIMTSNYSDSERDNTESMINSIKDFVLLLNAEKIIGTYNSSFSDEASFFKLIPKIIPLSDELITMGQLGILNYHCHNFKFNNNFGYLNKIK